ncbi:MAG: hypothetical protein VXY93_17975, partial [Pseudomonadota bacterium]|nr:hypothetical protein [Pseudomonadota bacterium]
FTAAPGVGDEIQVRHLGFAGATTADVSGFYGRTGNVVLTSNDHITTGNINAGIVTATSFDGTFSSSVGGSNANFTGIVTAGVFKGGDFDGRNLNISGIATFAGDVSIGGTLTYEDVTNIDSVGIVTAQKDVHVGAGLSVVGVSTLGTSGSVFLQHNGTERLRTTTAGIRINNAAYIENNGSNIKAAGLGINNSIFHNGDENTGIDFSHDDRI